MFTVWTHIHEEKIKYRFHSIDFTQHSKFEGTREKSESMFECMYYVYVFFFCHRFINDQHCQNYKKRVIQFE